MSPNGWDQKAGLFCNREGLPIVFNRGKRYTVYLIIVDNKPVEPNCAEQKGRQSYNYQTIFSTPRLQSGISFWNV